MELSDEVGDKVIGSVQSVAGDAVAKLCQSASGGEVAGHCCRTLLLPSATQDEDKIHHSRVLNGASTVGPTTIPIEVSSSEKCLWIREMSLVWKDAIVQERSVGYPVGAAGMRSWREEQSDCPRLDARKKEDWRRWEKKMGIRRWAGAPCAVNTGEPTSILKDPNWL